VVVSVVVFPIGLMLCANGERLWEGSGNGFAVRDLAGIDGEDFIKLCAAKVCRNSLVIVSNDCNFQGILLSAFLMFALSFSGQFLELTGQCSPNGAAIINGAEHEHAANDE
jgi:hypothetical protein